MHDFITLLLFCLPIGILVGLLLLYRKIEYSYFKCRRCGYSYRPFIYKPTAGGFAFQAFFPFFRELFIWLPIFFGRIFFRCPNCKKFTLLILQQPRKARIGILLWGIGLFLGIIIFIYLVILTLFMPRF